MVVSLGQNATRRTLGLDPDFVAAQHNRPAQWSTLKSGIVSARRIAAADAWPLTPLSSSTRVAS